MAQWEREAWSVACEVAGGVVKAWLEGLDKALMEKREAGLIGEGYKERRIVTLFGDVRIKRRLYRDKAGKRHFLLDEAVGLEKRSALSPGVRELSSLLATYLSFGKCAEVLRLLLPDPVSHTTVHRQVGRVAEPSLAREEREVRQVFEEGKVPERGERVVPHLFVEADGVIVALQREKDRRAEIKAGIAYEGWEEAGRGRHRLKNKTTYAGMMAPDRFWEGFSLNLAQKYDLGRIEHVVVGGDGAEWVKEGAGLLGADYQLDRFHLHRALLRGLGGNSDLPNRVYAACVAGNVALADSLLVQAQSQATGERVMEISRLRGYILDNASGLVDYRTKMEGEGLRGLGAMEGNVDKLIASRMKKRGMSWTRQGAQRMARLINLRQSGEVLNWIKPPSDNVASDPAYHRPRTAPTKPLGQVAADAWLQANLPALQGPHANRPWVRALNSLAHGTKAFL